jgi:uncharacterized protein (TIGR02300 family)
MGHQGRDTGSAGWESRAALPAALRYGKARPTSAGNTVDPPIRKAENGMIKPEWGTKRTCPKCATRFYDLEKNDPVTCIECGYAWEPEPILKSKQPLPFEQVKADKQEADSDLAGDDEDLAPADDEEVSADDEVDLGGDDDLGVETSNDDDENI